MAPPLWMVDGEDGENREDGEDREDGGNYVGAGFTTIFSVAPRCN